MLGGSVQGGCVLGQWPGLTREVLEGRGDLPVVNNYRNVLAPVLERHGATPELVFPEFDLRPLGLYAGRAEG